MARIQGLSNSELKVAIEKLVQDERTTTASVVEHLAEVDRRKLYIDWGFTSLYEYLTKHLKYSESSAYRRMQAARTVQQMPEIKKDLKDGTLKLSQISLAQTVFRKEEQATGEIFSVQEKRLVLQELKHKTAIQTQQILSQHTSQPVGVRTLTKYCGDESVHVSLRIPDGLMKKLDRVKELYSHIAPHGELIQILELMADDVIRKRDPLKRGTRTGATQSFAASEVKIQAVSRTTRTMIFKRDQSCQHRNPDGSKCGSRFQLEIDHIQPKFAGGTDEPSNLRLLCRTHNRFRYAKGAGLIPGPVKTHSNSREKRSVDTS